MATLALSTELVTRGIALRPEADADIPFLQRLYASTRWEELAPLTGWTDAQKLAFCESQFALQRHHYRTYYPDTAFDVIEAHGVPAGRLYLDRQERDILVVDIALLPEWRGRGIGTALLQAVLAEATAFGKAVTISVEKFNPAQTLYRRLGFEPYAEDDIYWFMRWQSPTASAGLS